MKFHLDHKPKKFDFEISHKDPIFLVGSCFAENIGKILEAYKFKVHINPNGILFNPASVLDCLETLVEEKSGDEKYFLEREGIHLSYKHHSSVNATSKTELAQKTKVIHSEANSQLAQSKFLIITFGTAFVYKHKALGTIVANCHKQPQETFEKQLLEVDEIVKNYSNLIKKIRILNPGIKIIFTVSPVKYLKDGLEANNLSKAVLLLAVHKLTESHPGCYYFPAYELVNDDLRDHRFYKKDLAHPNDLAIDYIWEKFSQTCFDAKTLELNKQIQKLNQALAHRKLQDSPAEAEKLEVFILKQKAEILRLDAGIRFQ